ncbi:MAG: DUF58 domain-containing protein [Bacteroidales bacterium]|nr:DUF58 domain-containing protein [Bacteroidales bacterium]NLM93238.1 DUF58 domain-containing protein [Bacteroidales bacterium]
MIEKMDPELPQKFGNLELLARQVVEGFITGLHKSPFHGFSVEFAEHRIYNPGESTRHIDWKLFARTEKLFIKRYEEETNLRCQLVIDNSSSMYFPAYGQNKPLPSKIGFSVECAAALSYLLRKQRDAVGLSIISQETELHTPARSSSVHHKMLFSELEKLYDPARHSLSKKSNTAELLHLLAENIHKRSLVIIFSDMIENVSTLPELFSALQHLKHNKHEVILFHVYEKSKELDFDFDSRPVKFIDMETGREVKMNPIEFKEQYNKSMAERFNKIKLKCMQYHIDFVPADINQGHEQVMLSFLVKRSRLY